MSTNYRTRRAESALRKRLAGVIGENPNQDEAMTFLNSAYEVAAEKGMRAPGGRPSSALNGLATFMAGKGGMHAWKRDLYNATLDSILAPTDSLIESQNGHDDASAASMVNELRLLRWEINAMRGFLRDQLQPASEAA